MHCGTAWSSMVLGRCIQQTLSGIVYTCCMLTYTTLQDRPREFLAATGLTHDECARLLPAFAAAYAVRYPPDKTWQGKDRQRQGGGGAKGVLPHMDDMLFFILAYEKARSVL